MRIDRADVEAAQRALEAVRDEWIGRRGVVSVDVARASRGRVPGSPCIRVTLERKLPPEEVPAGELFPRDHDGVRVELVEGSPSGLEL